MILSPLELSTNLELGALHGRSEVTLEDGFENGTGSQSAHIIGSRSDRAPFQNNQRLFHHLTRTGCRTIRRPFATIRLDIAIQFPARIITRSLCSLATISFNPPRSM